MLLLKKFFVETEVLVDLLTLDAEFSEETITFGLKSELSKL